MVEHVSRSLEESAKAVNEQPTKFPVMPAIVRPLLRGMFLKRAVKSGKFPRAKTNKPMDPDSGPATPAAGRARLETALSAFEQACRTRSATGATFNSTVFGALTVEDYGRFQALHTRHHRKQLPV